MAMRPIGLLGAENAIQNASTPCRRAGSGNSHRRSLRFEPLESRCLLSASPNNDALEVFSVSTALYVENQGQWQNDAVRCSFNGPGVDIAFTDEGLNFLLTQQEVLPDGEATGGDSLTATFDPRHDFDQDYITHTTQFTVSFDGANAATPVGLDEAITKFNYLVGDQANWREGVSGFATVAYENLYDGIDLHTFGRRHSLKYEFYVAPGADWRQIQIHYEGIEGLWIDDAGALHVQTALGDLVDYAPYIYQQIGGEKVGVAGSFVLRGDDTYAFDITESYDPNVELVIDPYLQWSTYLGGNNQDYGYGVAVDSSGNMLITGYTYSDGWVSGNYNNTYQSIDAYAVKLSSIGQHLWSTYIGGDKTDFGYGVAVDTSNNVVVT